LSFFLCLILIIEVTIIYFNQRESEFLVTQNYIQLNTDIINKLNLEYQKLPSKRKKLFLRRTGLSIVSDSEFVLENKPLPEFISRYFNTKQLLNADKEQKTLFLKNLLNEISKLSTTRAS
jgi:hypothetical protein